MTMALIHLLLNFMYANGSAIKTVFPTPANLARVMFRQPGGATLTTLAGAVAGEVLMGIMG